MVPNLLRYAHAVPETTRSHGNEVRLVIAHVVEEVMLPPHGYSSRARSSSPLATAAAPTWLRAWGGVRLLGGDSGRRYGRFAAARVRGRGMSEAAHAELRGGDWLD